MRVYTIVIVIKSDFSRALFGKLCLGDDDRFTGFAQAFRARGIEDDDVCREARVCQACGE